MMFDLVRLVKQQVRQKHVRLVALFLMALVAHAPLQKALAQATPAIAIPAIDFSHAGYGGGGIPLPDVPAVLTVRPTGGDDTRLLQAALDHVAGLPLQANEYRGALQLAEGKFLVSGQLRIKADGVVLRGSGIRRTTLVAMGKSRRSLIEAGSKKAPKSGTSVNVTDNVVPAGSHTLTIEHVQGLRVGDPIIITRPSTKEWISDLGMDTLKGIFPDLRFHWVLGSRNLVWDRTITAIDPATKQITLDAPITTALEQKYGGGTVAKVSASAPFQYIGLENLVLGCVDN